MSLPWFFEDATVDHAALEELGRVAAAAALLLDDSAAERLRLGAARLAFCAGPFADDLADELVRRSAEARDLADQCRGLLSSVVAAGEDARAEQARRDGLRDTYRSELAHDAARARQSVAGADPASTTVEPPA